MPRNNKKRQQPKRNNAQKSKKGSADSSRDTFGVPTNTNQILKQNKAMASNPTLFKNVLKEERGMYSHFTHEPESIVHNILRLEEHDISKEQLVETLLEPEISAQSNLQVVKIIDPDALVNAAFAIIGDAIAKGLPICSEKFTLSNGQVVGKLYACLLANLLDLVSYINDEGVVIKKDEYNTAALKRAVKKTVHVHKKTGQTLALSWDEINFMDLYGSLPLITPDGCSVSWVENYSSVQNYNTMESTVPTYTEQMVREEMVPIYGDLIQAISSSTSLPFVTFDEEMPEYDRTIAAFCIKDPNVGLEELTGTSLRTRSKFLLERPFRKDHAWIAVLGLAKYQEGDNTITPVFTHWAGTGPYCLKISKQIKEGVLIKPFVLPVSSIIAGDIHLCVAGDMKQTQAPSIWSNNNDIVEQAENSIFNSSLADGVVYSAILAAAVTRNAESNYYAHQYLPLPSIQMFGTNYLPIPARLADRAGWRAAEERNKLMQPSLLETQDGNLVYSACAMFLQGIDPYIADLDDLSPYVAAQIGTVPSRVTYSFDNDSSDYPFANPYVCLTSGGVANTFGLQNTGFVFALQDSVPTMGIFESSNEATVFGTSRILYNAQVATNIDITSDAIIDSLVSSSPFKTSTFGFEASNHLPCIYMGDGVPLNARTARERLNELAQQAYEFYFKISEVTVTDVNAIQTYESPRLFNVLALSAVRHVIEKYSSERSDIGVYDQVIQVKGQGGLSWLGLSNGVDLLKDLIPVTKDLLGVLGVGKSKIPKTTPAQYQHMMDAFAKANSGAKMFQASDKSHSDMLKNHIIDLEEVDSTPKEKLVDVVVTRAEYLSEFFDPAKYLSEGEKLGRIIIKP